MAKYGKEEIIISALYAGIKTEVYKVHPNRILEFQLTLPSGAQHRVIGAYACVSFLDGYKAAMATMAIQAVAVIEMPAPGEVH